jgi:chromate transporter
VVAPGPLIRRYEHNRRLQGFIKGATAAAVGAIAGAAIVIAQQVIEDGWSVAIALLALVALLQRHVTVSEPALVAVAALVGLVAFG